MSHTKICLYKDQALGGRDTIALNANVGVAVDSEWMRKTGKRYPQQNTFGWRVATHRGTRELLALVEPKTEADVLGFGPVVVLKLTQSITIGIQRLQSCI